MLRVKLTRLVCSFVVVVASFIAVLPRSGAAGQDEAKQTPWQQVTHASWYGKEFAGKPTAAGGLFNPHRLTAAHRTLRLGSWVKVTELRSRRAVVVQITDRGPYLGNRGIDLSYAAAQQLGIVRRGVARVHIELLDSSTERVASRTIGSNTLMVASSCCAVSPLLPESTVQWRSRIAQHSPEGQRSEIRS